MLFQSPPGSKRKSCCACKCITFTFRHLTDAFIQNELRQANHLKLESSHIVLTQSLLYLDSEQPSCGDRSLRWCEWDLFPRKANCLNHKPEGISDCHMQCANELVMF